MAEQIIKVPDIGGATQVSVIEVLVKAGDRVEIDTPLITLEGDKATMEIPSPQVGLVKQIQVKVGDKVSEGSVILSLEAQEAVATPVSASVAATSSIQEVHVPDIGGAKGVSVIEVLVKAGDHISEEQSLLTLEGDKATMEVPSPLAGEVVDVTVKVGDKLSQGDLILHVKSSGKVAVAAGPKLASPMTPTKTVAAVAPATASGDQFASPGVRRLAREFELDLKQIRATGAKGRITRDDVKNYVKSRLKSGGFNFAPAPEIDFSKFGAIETQELSKIKKLSGANLSRNWVSIPHVTQFDEADITEMEAYRQASKDKMAAQGVKLTPLVFIMKAVVAALKQHPLFNSSLDASGEKLILKKYFHVGVAVETPNGLMVPVIRDVDKKSPEELAKELAAISTKAREKGLSITEMQGSCFTITSLGGIGGTAFTPIINAPDVAILGVSKSQMKPVYQKEGNFVPRLMLPLCLSYDHRVIDGADAARFIVSLSQALTHFNSLV